MERHESIIAKLDNGGGGYITENQESYIIPIVWVWKPDICVAFVFFFRYSQDTLSPPSGAVSPCQEEQSAAQTEMIQEGNVRTT